MRRLIPPLAAIAALALALTLTRTMGQQGNVMGSDHDLGSAGVSACEQCHIPHAAYGDLLWSQPPSSAEGPYSGDRILCYSCHDGTVTPEGSFVFDQMLSQHPVTAGEFGQDCDMCHDAHSPDYGNFLLFPSGANLCKTCHAKATFTDHPSNADAVAAGYVPADSDWDPNAGDFSGTRLWDPQGSQPGNRVKCLSCHAAHGAVKDTALNTMPLNDPETTASPLCQNCHQ